MSIINEFGNIDNHRHREFERKIGLEVRDYLQTLIDEGIPLAEVRLAAHYLMGFISLMESEVTLKRQIKMRRQRKHGLVKGMEERLSRMNNDLGEKVDELSRRLRREGEDPCNY
jgi:hypothetical protein